MSDDEFIAKFEACTLAILTRYYREETLSSGLAKSTFVLPDKPV
jgi:hypothetical protein